MHSVQKVTQMKLVFVRENKYPHKSSLDDWPLHHKRKAYKRSTLLVRPVLGMTLLSGSNTLLLQQIVVVTTFC